MHIPNAVSETLQCKQDSTKDCGCNQTQSLTGKRKREFDLTF